MNCKSKSKHKSIKSLEDNIGEKLGDFGFGNDLLYTNQQHNAGKGN